MPDRIHPTIPRERYVAAPDDSGTIVAHLDRGLCDYGYCPNPAEVVRSVVDVNADRVATVELRRYCASCAHIDAELDAGRASRGVHVVTIPYPEASTA